MICVETLNGKRRLYSFEEFSSANIMVYIKESPKHRGYHVFSEGVSYGVYQHTHQAINIAKGVHYQKESGEKTIRLFVYGTLQKGYGLNDMLGTSKFLGESHTAKGYQLWSLGCIPAVTLGDSVVHGELYEVSTLVIPSIDDVEGAYERTEITLYDGTKAYAYLMHGERMLRGGNSKVECGKWKTYSPPSRWRHNLNDIEV